MYCVAYPNLAQTQPFVSSPTKIIFQDFCVGETMTKTIQITNSSFTVNSFRVLPLSGRAFSVMCHIIYSTAIQLLNWFLRGFLYRRAE